MQVTVYYDYICPFCYLGLKRLEILKKEFPMEIEWKGIEIHPEIPPQGTKSAKTLKLAKIAEDITEINGEETGIAIKLPPLVANSRLSLEASEFAKSQDKLDEFHAGIYEAYFEHGQNIGDENVILQVGEKAGLPKKELEECLKQRTMLKKIEQNKQEAEANLVFSVPTLFFGRFPVHGVQTLESLRKIIARAIERS